MADIRVLPVHRGGSSKVHHYTATFWVRGQPKISRQGTTAAAALASLKRAMNAAVKAPFSTANNVAGAVPTFLAGQADKSLRTKSKR